MKIKIFWKDINIINVIRKNNVYISSLDYENFIKANKLGMPISLFFNYEMISTELPTFIKDRLPTPKIISNQINENKVSSDISIIDYINKTRCKCVTDKIEILLEN
ncbi:unknown [Clostridium sp. CAG:921]|mgnify:FL=1|nr:unknown [Clostridium sp. CAG:921]